MPDTLTDQQLDEIKRNFKRCQPGTIEAVLDLRRTGNIDLIPVIVRGIVWRYVREENRGKVEQATAETELVSLGIDSLTMMEIVLDVQDALDVVVEDADLKGMQTIGDVFGFLQRRYSELHPQT